MIISVPPIIGKELLEKAQAQIAGRNRNSGKHQAPEMNIFARHIYHKGTNQPVHCRKDKKNPDNKLFRLSTAEHGIRWVSFETVQREAVRTVEEECRQARRMAAYMCTADAEKCRCKIRKQYTEKLRSIGLEIAEKKREYLAAVKRPETGAAEENAESSALKEKMDMLDAQWDAQEEEERYMETICSRQNPWIQRFNLPNPHQKMTSKEVRMWIERIEMDETGITVTLLRQKEKEAIPEEWFQKGR